MKASSSMRVAVVICALLFQHNSLEAEVNLLDIFAEELDSPNNPAIATYLDRSVSPDPAAKQLTAHGLTFSGRIKVKDSKINTVSYWSDDPQLPISKAESAFKAIASAIQQKYGPGKTANVPNYEDASTAVTHVLRWRLADDVLLLSIRNDSQRAVLSLVRAKQATWLNDMGADENGFWREVLKSDGESFLSNEVQATPTLISTTPAVSTTSAQAARAVSSATPTVAQTPVHLAKRKKMVWLSVVGIVVLMVIVALIWKRCR
jgi:hypothetical protein